MATDENITYLSRSNIVSYCMQAIESKFRSKLLVVYNTNK